MKDKKLRKALGIHGSEEDLCGCDCAGYTGWQGEIPMLWRKVKELEDKVKAIEVKKNENMCFYL